MPTPRPVAKTFAAMLERTGDRLNWTIVRVPFDVAKVWGARGQLKVAGQISGFAFRTSLFPTGKGGHILMVNKKMQAGGKVAPGMKARFRLEPDTAPRVVSPPEELLRALRQSKQLHKYYQSLNYSIRDWIAKQVDACKQAGTRLRRSQQIAERLLETMATESAPPPPPPTSPAPKPPTLPRLGPISPS